MWRRVLVVWSASRLAVLSLGYLLTVELGWHRALQPWQTRWVRAVTGWDSVFYIRISHVGYHRGLLIPSGFEVITGLRRLDGHCGISVCCQ